MTLVLDGIPSAGGPRSRRSRGRACALPALPSLSPVASLVTSLSASGWASAAPASSAAGAAPSSFFSSCNHVSGVPVTRKKNNLGETYTAAATTASTPTTGTASPATTTGRLTAAGTFSTTLGVGTLGLLVRLGLASELDRDLALQDLLAGELGDGTLGLAGSREVDEGVTDRAVGARVLRDRNRLTAWGVAWLAMAVERR